jgi:hypothetical protein
MIVADDAASDTGGAVPVDGAVLYTGHILIPCRLEWQKWRWFFQLVNRFVELEVKMGPYCLFFY